MAGGHGGSRAGAGRPPNIDDPQPPADGDDTAPRYNATSGVAFLQEIYQDETLPLTVRAAAAREAAAYETPRGGKAPPGTNIDPETLSNEVLALIAIGMTYEEAAAANATDTMAFLNGIGTARAAGIASILRDLNKNKNPVTPDDRDAPDDQP